MTKAFLEWWAKAQHPQGDYPHWVTGEFKRLAWRAWQASKRDTKKQANARYAKEEGILR